MASRHVSRISVLQALFSADVYDDLSLKAVEQMYERNTLSLPRADENEPFTRELIKGVVAKRNEIDAVIQKAAPQWPIQNIAPVDRNVLRIGLYELLFSKNEEVPPKVALNEAIELAKTFGGSSSGRFINGVLGAVYRDIGSPRKDEAIKEKDAREFLAGVVVVASDAQTAYVALVRDPFNRWTLPKTRYEEGELSDAAALRAAAEELGLTLLTLKAPLREHEYTAHEPDKGTMIRRVGYFLALSDKLPLKPQKGQEITEAKWFSVDELDGLELYDDLRPIIQSGIVAAV